MTLVDTNVILDILNADPRWSPWSAAQLSKARRNGVVAINAIIYAELAVQPESFAVLDEFLQDLQFDMPPLNKQAARLAGEAFGRYRQRKGQKTGVLPDFFIGAQAKAMGWDLLTRDVSRYATYFPQVNLICP